ncbi:PilZ domain-containing protein [Thalassotalea piscium]
MQNINNDKLAKYNEYFSIEHEFVANIKPLSTNTQYHYDDFLEQIPTPFKLATQVSSIDSLALQPLQTIGGVANQLVQYLNLQSQKIDLLMNYIISQQDEALHRFQGVSFSGSGIRFNTEKMLPVSSNVEMKLFINIDNCNIYCHGEVIDVTENDTGYQHKVLFHHIRDDDRELLVRCSLHLQQKQLQALAQKRKDISTES